MLHPKRQSRGRWLRSSALRVLGRLYGTMGERVQGQHGILVRVGPSLHCSRRLIHCRLPHPTANRLLPHLAPPPRPPPRHLLQLSPGYTFHCLRCQRLSRATVSRVLRNVSCSSDPALHKDQVRYRRSFEGISFLLTETGGCAALSSSKV